MPTKCSTYACGVGRPGAWSRSWHAQENEYWGVHLANLKKYQVFLSSTFVDLKKERQDVIGIILDMGHVPAGMEMFPAADVGQLDHIKRIIDQCDYYVLIIAARYGSTDEAGISFTEREYDYAVEQGKVVLAFPHAAPADLTMGADVDKLAAEKFEKFRQKVMRGRLVKSWVAREDLNSKVIIALHHAMTDMPQAGWVRGDVVASEETLVRSIKLQEENEELRRSLLNMEARIQPNLEGLADMDDKFVVRYRNFSNGKFYIIGVSLTWRELFQVLGPIFCKRSTRDNASISLKTHLRQMHGMPDGANVLDLDENTIYLQFESLGLIKSSNAESKSGVIQEFLLITEYGRDRLMEISVVRKTT